MMRALWSLGFVATTLATGCRSGTEPSNAIDQLAFVTTDLQVVNADGSGDRVIWDDAANNHVPACPSWAPDGSAIAFHEFSSSQIFVVSVASGAARQLTTGPDLNECPVWSPDGTHIAYVSGPSNGPYHLYLMNPDGSGKTQLGTASYAIDRGTWSPDGRSLVVPSIARHLVLVDAATGATTELTTGPDDAPSYSPDGTSIVFARELSTTALFVMHADGSSVRQLTPSGNDDNYPTWSPDGKAIVFRRYVNGPCPGCPTAVMLMASPAGDPVPWSDGQVHMGEYPTWRPRKR